MQTFLLLLLSYTTFLVQAAPQPQPQPQPKLGAKVQCIGAAILAPLEDCAAILTELRSRYGGPGCDEYRTWGRTISPTLPPDYSRIQLPYGFRYTQTNPRGRKNHCEIHVDNDISKLETSDGFTMMELVAAGVYVLEQCYAMGMAQTGKAYPASGGNVYVTTLWSLGGEWEGQGENVTALRGGLVEGFSRPREAGVDAF